MSVEQFAQGLLNLLPPGIAFNNEKDSGTNNLLESIASELDAVESAAVSLIEEANPVTMTFASDSRFTECGLPDTCSTLDVSQGEKQLQVLGKWAALGGACKNYFIAVLAKYGYTVKIWEYYSKFPSFRIEQTAIETFGVDDAFTSVWEVSFADSSLTYFTAGASTAGDFLDRAVANNISCIIDRIKPAHTYVIYNPVDQATFDSLPST